MIFCFGSCSQELICEDSSAWAECEHFMGAAFAQMAAVAGDNANTLLFLLIWFLRILRNNLKTACSPCISLES